MWTSTFYGDLRPTKNSYKTWRNGQAMVEYYDDEATVKEKIAPIK